MLLNKNVLELYKIKKNIPDFYPYFLLFNFGIRGHFFQSEYLALEPKMFYKPITSNW